MRDFINARMNKDNFWNLMFFATLAGGVGIAFATNIMILSWFAIAGSIWIAKRNSSIIFDKDKLEFVINEKKRIKAWGGEFIILLFSSFGAVAIIGFILDGLKIDDSSLILAIMMSLLVFLPVLYCILRNLPIGVYFKKEAWIGNGKTSCRAINSDNNFANNAFNDSKRTSMNYDYLSDNMYHNSYLDRYYRK